MLLYIVMVIIACNIIIIFIMIITFSQVKQKHYFVPMLFLFTYYITFSFIIGEAQSTQH